jgi:oligoribonuclease NrnB/cAMP/cGMP phosphodiesterase (DHH superfamily)
MTTIIFHNSDLDGMCSAAIVKLKYPDAELIPMNYGWDFPWGNIDDPAETVFMVDFSLDSNRMDALNKMCNLVWVDHHQTSLNDCKDLTINGLRRIGTGACQLVWEYLYPNNKVPVAVKLLAQYDIWDHSNPDVLPFQYGIRLQDTHPDGYIWRDVLKSVTPKFLIMRLINDGKTVLKYVEQSNKIYCSSYMFETELDGNKCAAINVGLSNSKFFDSIDASKYDMLITFAWHKKHWKISLYSDKMDVSLVAEKYKGGGHAGSAGFVCDNLPFKLKGGYTKCFDCVEKETPIEKSGKIKYLPKDYFPDSWAFQEYTKNTFGWDVED